MPKKFSELTGMEIRDMGEQGAEKAQQVAQALELLVTARPLPSRRRNWQPKPLKK